MDLLGIVGVSKLVPGEFRLASGSLGPTFGLLGGVTNDGEAGESGQICGGLGIGEVGTGISSCSGS